MKERQNSQKSDELSDTEEEGKEVRDINENYLSFKHWENLNKNETIDELKPFGELFEEQKLRIKESSPYSSLKTWEIVKIIVKSGNDLRPEQFAMQLISRIDQTFKAHKVKIWLYPYEIITTGRNCGIIIS